MKVSEMKFTFQWERKYTHGQCHHRLYVKYCIYWILQPYKKIEMTSGLPLNSNLKFRLFRPQAIQAIFQVADGKFSIANIHYRFGLSNVNRCKQKHINKTIPHLVELIIFQQTNAFKIQDNNKNIIFF